MRLIEIVMLVILFNVVLAGASVLGLNIVDQSVSQMNISLDDFGNPMSDVNLVGGNTNESGSLDCSNENSNDKISLACKIQTKSNELYLAQSGVDSQKSFLDNVKMLIDGLVFFAETIGTGVVAPGHTFGRIMSTFQYGDLISKKQINFMVGLINIVMWFLYGIAAVQLMSGRDLRNSR